MKKVNEVILFITVRLGPDERMHLERKLKKKFDVFLPDGYSMLSQNYLWDKPDAGKKTEGECEDSCARTYLAFST